MKAIHTRTIIFYLCVALGLSACANQPVHFTSAPSGATVTVNGVSERTPCTLRLPRGAHAVQIRAENGALQHLTVYSGMNATAAGLLAATLTSAGHIFVFIGHVGTQALHGEIVHDSYAVIRVGVGVVGLGSLALGNALVHAGNKVAALRDDAGPPTVHVVFSVPAVPNRTRP